MLAGAACSRLRTAAWSSGVVHGRVLSHARAAPVDFAGAQLTQGSAAHPAAATVRASESEDVPHLVGALLPDQVASDAQRVLVDGNHLLRQQDRLGVCTK